MQKDEIKETPADVSAKRRTIWQRLSTKGGIPGFPMVIKIVLGAMVLAGTMVGIAALYANVPPAGNSGAAIDFPQKWIVGWEIIKFIDKMVDWVVINWQPFFSAINIGVLRILVPLENFFLWLPWWFIVIVMGFISWRIVSVKFAWITMGSLLVMVVMGLLDLGLMTLAITLTVTLLCVALGIPIGIAAAKSDRFDGMLRPLLDGMQTMPSFVYLIPALMLFGLGKTPAVVATCIYAIPPIIRLTNLGIRQVAPQVIEASQAFGATSWQLMNKVQIPLALPSILAGMNQTIMMALAMVVVASMVGAKGLGVEVLNGIARLEPGRGFIAGMGIVLMAIILDRISQGIARKPQIKRGTS